MEILFEDKFILVLVKPPELDTEKELLPLAEAHTGAPCHLVHRLDRGTGGVIVLAKTPAAAAKLSAAIQARELVKEYLAVVKGIPEPPVGSYSDLLYRDRAKNKSYVVTRERRGVKRAELDYRLLGKADGMSLVRIRLKTGRTHQIRVQFSHRGMPLFGDGRYGGGGGSLALWSALLSFSHPVSGQKMLFESVPQDIYPWTLFDRKDDTI